MRLGFNPWVGKICWRRAWQPTSVFLPGDSHGRKSLVGYSPRGRKESDTTEKVTACMLKTQSLVNSGFRKLLSAREFCSLSDLSPFKSHKERIAQRLPLVSLTA